jgi:hypothetical protein
MSRLRRFDDTVAHLCYEYLHGDCDEPTKVKIYEAVHSVVSQKDAPMYVFEIAYAIGYAKSALQDFVSETTYKKRKKAIRDRLAEILQDNCEYCLEFRTLYQYSSYLNLYIGTDPFGNRTLEVEGDKCPPYMNCSAKDTKVTTSFIINFCPACGRKLKRGERPWANSKKKSTEDSK